MSGPNRAERRAWPKRRHWLDRVASDSRLTAGAKSWLLLLARRSDDQGKPVWGNQERMAEQLGRCRSSIIRYCAEAEALGYLRVFRSTPERDRATGRWHRRKANSYYFCVPARDTSGRPAPRRRQRAPYCVVSPRRQRSADLRRDPATSSPDWGAQTAPAPPVTDFEPAENPEQQWTGEMSTTVLDAIARAKAHLAASQVDAGYRRRSVPAPPATAAPSCT